MTYEDFNSILQVLQDAEKRILDVKGAIYSKGKDRFHNFKAMAELSGNKPIFCAFTLMLKHFIALSDWIYVYNKKQDNGISENEFIQLKEFIIDIRNYLVFMFAMICENYGIDE